MTDRTSRRHFTRQIFALTGGLFALASGVTLAGCGPQQNSGGGSQPPTNAAEMSKNGAALSGQIVIDGSSTVLPISEAVAEEFKKENPGVNITVGKSGTGGGFKKFVAKEIDLADASRPIDAKEVDGAKTAGVEYIELPVAYDGLSLVVNPKNTFATTLTTDELKKIWITGSTVKTWADVRAGFPATPIKLFGPGTDSGTFDYFTEAICAKKGASRADYTASEDDNVLVTGVAGDDGALGYFGFAYYEQNADKLKLVGIDSGKGAILPSPETIANGTYSPLSRPLFLYVRKDAADRPEVAAFVKFYLSHAKDLVKSAGYIPLPDKAYELAAKRFDSKTTGSLFLGEPQIGIKIEELLAREGKP